MGEVLEGREGNDAPLAVEHGDCEEGGFNEFEDLGVGVDAVVHIVLANLNQVNNLIAVVRVGAPQHDALKVEVTFLLIHFHISFHLLLLLSQTTIIISIAYLLFIYEEFKLFKRNRPLTL